MSFLGGGFFGSGASESTSSSTDNSRDSKVSNTTNAGFSDIDGEVSNTALNVGGRTLEEAEINFTDGGAVKAALGFADKALGKTLSSADKQFIQIDDRFEGFSDTVSKLAKKQATTNSERITLLVGLGIAGAIGLSAWRERKT